MPYTPIANASSRSTSQTCPTTTAVTAVALPYSIVPVIKWNISQSSVAQSQSLDQEALRQYSRVYQEYYQGGLVDVDCLGMLKYFYCAQVYPICTATTPTV